MTDRIPSITVIRQPDDPGIEDESESVYAPLRFEHVGAGREVILLGVIRIGEILPGLGHSLTRVSVLFRLPDAPRTMFGAATRTHAKHQAARLTREWIEAAGLRT